jgi:hypothetical protein
MSEPFGVDDARFEVKFVARAGERHGLERWARTHWAGFFERYPPRVVNSVYFDSYEYYSYEAAACESREREKLRLRWYGDLHRVAKGAVERKSRRARLGWKATYPVGALSLAGVRWTEIRQTIAARLPACARLRFDAVPAPVLVTRYQRRYLVSAGENIRMTIDWDQRLFDQRLASTPNFERETRMPDTVVLEFKFGPDDRRLASRMMQELPVRVSRNSKYLIGVQAIVSQTGYA